MMEKSQIRLVMPMGNLDSGREGGGRVGGGGERERERERERKRIKGREREEERWVMVYSPYNEEGTKTKEY